MTSSIDCLPPPLLPLIFQHLPITTLLVLPHLCHAFHTAAHSKSTFLHTRLRIHTPHSPHLHLTPDSLITSLPPSLLLPHLHHSLPHLHSLDLTSAWSPHQPDVTSSFIASLPSLTQIRHLTLPLLIATPLTTSDVSVLSLSLPSLLSLSVPNSREVSDFLALSSLSSLTSLSLHRLRAKTFHRHSLHSLTTLPSLSSLTLDFTGVASLAPLLVLSDCLHLTHLTLVHAKGLPPEVFEGLATLPLLSSLHLIRCSLSHPLPSFAALTASHSLRTLAAPLSVSSASALPLLNRLTHLICNDQHGVGDGGLSLLSSASSLRSFSSHSGGTAEQRYTDEGVVHLSTLPSLTTLRLLFGYTITGIGFDSRDATLWCSLTSLTLSYCGLTDGGLQAIARGCRRLQKLTIKFLVYVDDSDVEGLTEEKTQFDPSPAPSSTHLEEETSTYHFSRGPSRVKALEMRMRSVVTAVGYGAVVSLPLLTSLNVLYQRNSHPPLPYVVDHSALGAMFGGGRKSSLHRVGLTSVVVIREVGKVIEEWKRARIGRKRGEPERIVLMNDCTEEEEKEEQG